MQKSIFFTVSLVQYAVGLSSDPNRLYKQICNVVFFYNKFHQLLAIEMSFTAGYSLAAASLSAKMFECVPLETTYVIAKLPGRTVLCASISNGFVKDSVCHG